MTEPAATHTHFSTALLRELLAAGFLISAVLLLTTRYSHLPATIRSPFNHGGDMHDMAARSQVWLLPFIAGWIFCLASLINFIPPEAINSSKSLSAPEQASTLAGVKAFIGWFKVIVMAGLAVWVYVLSR